MGYTPLSHSPTKQRPDTLLKGGGLMYSSP